MLPRHAIVARGIELDASLDVGTFRLSGGYVPVDSEMRADGAAAALDGRRPAQTPRDSASATIAWRGGIAQASLTARYVGAQFEDDLGTERLPDAVTFDATASVPVTDQFSVELRGENLANQRVVAGISGAGIVERATPRTLWVGVRLSR